MSDEALSGASAQALKDLRLAVASARRLHLVDAWETKPDGFGKWDWMAIAVRDGEDAIARLRDWAAPWLAEQPDDVRRAVDDLERELSGYKVEAMAHGAVVLPRDLPRDPEHRDEHG